MHIKVLCATRYDFKDEATERSIRGAKVTYEGSLFSPDDTKGKGVQVLTVSAPYALYDALPNTLPAKVDATISQKLSGINVVLVLDSVKAIPATAPKA